MRSRVTTLTARLCALVAASAVAAACTGPGGDAVLSSRPPGPTATPAPAPPSVAPTTTSRATPEPRGPGALVSPAGVVVPVVSRDGDRWTVTTPCGETATVSEGTFVPAATIVLDPGHGGSDPGARSPDGLEEESVNLAVARHTEAALTAEGVATVLARTGDYDLELNVRAEIAKALSAHAFVSVHHNAEPDGRWPGPGSETYYQIGSSESKRLAGLIYEEVVRTLSRYTVAWVADRDAGVKYRPGRRGDYYAVLRQPAPIVSVLVEFAFISNPPEAELLARQEVQKAEGEAVARGILRYLRTDDAGSGFVEPYPRPDPPPAPGGPGPACADPAL